MTNLSAAKINNILYIIDPMDIGTVENNLTDEYKTRADNIAMLISSGVAIKAAIKAEFEYAFWKGCISELNITKTLQLLNSSV